MPIIRLALFSLALAAAAANVSSAQTKDPRPSATLRDYSTVSLHAAAEYGDIRLSRTRLYFAKLKGRLDLRFQETMGEGADALAIYRALNGAQFAQENAGEPCAVTWVGISRVDRDTIWVHLFDIADYHQYNPRGPGICSSDAYALDPTKH